MIRKQSKWENPGSMLSEIRRRRYSQIKVMKTDSCIKKEYRSLFFGRVEKRIDVAASSVLY